MYRVVLRSHALWSSLVRPNTMDALYVHNKLLSIPGCESCVLEAGQQGSDMGYLYRMKPEPAMYFQNKF